MAVSKTITLQGGFQATAYLVIRSARLDRITGEIECVIWSFATEQARRDYNAALTRLQDARELMAAPYEPMTADEHSKQAIGRLRVQRAAEEHLAECNPGMLYGNLQIAAKDAGSAIKDGMVDVAALYELTTKQGGPLCGGTDC